jgi:hypothetical protein
MTFHLPFLLVAIAAVALSPAPARGEEAVWVVQKAGTPKHRFEVSVRNYDGGEYRASEAIRVIDRATGAPLQDIAPAASSDTSLDAALFVQVLDANADGYPDVSLFVDSGGAGPNSSRNFYLFDPRSGQYLLHAGLSELTQASVDKDGLIHSAQRGGCCQHGSATYRFIGGKLTELSSLDETLAPDGKALLITIGKRRKGKMHYQTRRRPLPANYQ